MLKTNEITHDVVVSLVSKELDIDKRVVDAPCRHLCVFTSECIRDTENVRPVRWRYIGIFAIRKGLKKK